MYSRPLVPSQGVRQLKEFRAIQIGHHPVRHLRAVPVEDLVALRILLLYRSVGRAMIRPHEYVNVMQFASVDDHSDRLSIHVIESPAD